MEATTYLFRVSYDGKSRLLIVVAPNSEAAEPIEAVLAKDGRASPTCEAVASFPGTKPTVRSGAELVPYQDFMVQMVDPDRLLKDVKAAGAFTKSMANMASDRVRSASLSKFPTVNRLLRKSGRAEEPKAAEEPKEERPAQRAQPEAQEVASPGKPGQAANLISGLMNLGFKKPDVQRFVDGLGERVNTGDIQSLILEGLQALNGRRS